MSKSIPWDSKSHRSAKSVSEISKVSVDAYNKLWDDIRKRKEAEKKTEIEKLVQLKAQEEAEHMKELKAKYLITKTNEHILEQIKETQMRKNVEKAVDKEMFNEVIKAMPDNLVNVFPRITETPATIRRDKKVQQQNDLKTKLLEQIGAKVSERRVHKKGDELEAIRKDVEMHNLETNLKLATQRDIMQKYKDELLREIQLNNIKKLAEKVEDDRDLERLLQAKDLLAPSLEEELSPSKISEYAKNGSLAIAKSPPDNDVLLNNEGEGNELPEDPAKQDENAIDEQKEEAEKEAGVEDAGTTNENVVEEKHEQKEVINEKKEAPLTERMQQKQRIYERQRQMRIKLLQEQLFRKQQDMLKDASKAAPRSVSNSQASVQNLASNWKSPVRAEEPRIYRQSAANILSNYPSSKSPTGKKINASPDARPIRVEVRIPKGEVLNKNTGLVMAVHETKVPTTIKESNNLASKISASVQRPLLQLPHGGNSHNFFVTHEIA